MNNNNLFLYSFLITISLGTFQFGYSIGVFNTLQVPFAGIFGWYEFQVGQEPDFTSANNWSTIITSVCTVGSAFGAIGSGSLVKYGKLKCIYMTNILVCIASGIVLIENVIAICIGRFLYGLATGSFSVFVPLFINETAPFEIKGPVGVMTQFFVTFGIMISFLLGVPIPSCPITSNYSGAVTQADFDSYTNWLNNTLVQQYWRFMFGLPILVAVLQIILLVFFFNYETPKTLKLQGKDEKLTKLMNRIYTDEQIAEVRIVAIPVEEKSSNDKDQQPTYG